MGFINDLKKIFFGVESLGKSAADKAGKKGKEVVDDIKEKTGEFKDEWYEENRENIERSKKNLEDLGENVREKSDKFWDKTKEVSEDIGDRILHGKKKESPSDTGSEDPFKESKSKEDPLSEKSESEFVDAAKKKAEEIGRKVEEEGRKFADKAKEVLDNPEESVDKAMEKADELAKKLKDRVTTDVDDFSETTLDEKMREHKESTLKDKDDFFSKADRFASGDHHAFDSDADKPKITKQESTEASKKKEKKGTVPGFEDRDGDGDELVDDAEIVDEEE